MDGNHENFDTLNALPVEEWHGGMIHRVRPNLLHLTRGQIFDLDGHTLFTMGGASSHDIESGILDAYAPDFERQYWTLRHMGARFRVAHYSWWEEELPSEEEYAAARASLKRAPDRLTDFLEEVNGRLKFHYWLFGHYHDNCNIGERHVLLWEQIVRIV